jgi:hypothetical protein
MTPLFTVAHEPPAPVEEPQRERVVFQAGR